MEKKIYLVRGVNVNELAMPLDNLAEMLAFSFVVMGKQPGSSCSASVTCYHATSPFAGRRSRPSSIGCRQKRFTTGAWVRGPMTGLTLHAKD